MVRRTRPICALTILYDDVSHLRGDFCPSTNSTCAEHSVPEAILRATEQFHKRLLKKARAASQNDELPKHDGRASKAKCLELIMPRTYSQATAAMVGR